MCVDPEFFIPVTGNINILNYKPADIIYIGGGGGNFYMKGNELVAEFINFNNSAEEIKHKYDSEVSGIHNNYGALRKNIEDYNGSLKPFINEHLNDRKQTILNKQSLLSSLGVPLKKKPNVPATFAVPKPQLREKIIIKPVVVEKGYKPEQL